MKMVLVKKALWICMSFLLVVPVSGASSDARQMVELPEMMQSHMLANMRNHLETIDLILEQMSANKLDKAADTAEQSLGMSSLDKHGAEHLAKFMPEAMRKAGTNMHRAASRFSLKAQEGDALAAYASLQNVTAACVACHASYRIR